MRSCGWNERCQGTLFFWTQQNENTFRQNFGKLSWTTAILFNKLNSFFLNQAPTVNKT
ncbi:hypothetical protein Mapa_017062 [Marchantia paleacea]|nr:hypothetical protein Mapa_017062 [Marchantia paleacea]